MATAFVAMNEVYGRFFDVNPLEMLGAAHAQGTVPEDLFVFDDQLHMIRESMDGPLALRALLARRRRCGEGCGLRQESVQRRRPARRVRPRSGRRGTRGSGRARSAGRTSSW
jgi:hypothetical protein